MSKRKLSKVQEIDKEQVDVDEKRGGKLSQIADSSPSQKNEKNGNDNDNGIGNDNDNGIGNDNVYARTQHTKTEGRGSLSGWATCPLCTMFIYTQTTNSNYNYNTNTSKKGSGTARTTKQQQKKYALGRGISMHLQQVHTPWRPGKAELARRQRLRRRVQGVVYRTFCRSEVEGNKVVTDTTRSIVDRRSQNQSQSGSGSECKCNSPINDDVLSNIPQVQKGETQEDYKERLLKLYLGDVWDRVINDAKNHKTGKRKGTEIGKDSIWGRPTHYVPTEMEEAEWSKKVLAIAQGLEQEFESNHTRNEDEATSINTCVAKDEQPSSSFILPGLDRNGARAHSYKESLPPFIKAAADGHLDILEQMVSDACMNTQLQLLQRPSRKRPRTEIGQDSHVSFMANHDAAIKKLLETRDRNGSSAEHWAAGNGHLKCLQYLMNLPQYDVSTCMTSSSKHIDQNGSKRRRRRDGKTSLHYAARNGHTHILRHLLDGTISTSGDESESVNVRVHSEVDITSGDGTTPLHLACYGGHLHTIQYLIDDKNANVHKVNDWDCGVGHWIAMSVQSNKDELTRVLNYVKGVVVNGNNSGNGNGKISSFDIFGRVQKHGHSSLHKAAQKLNRHIIEWVQMESMGWTEEERKLASGKDKGGNKPSGIWSQMGGAMEFREWMEVNVEP